MPAEPNGTAAAPQSVAPELTTREFPRAPMALKIVALLFLLEGTMGITGMLLKFFVIKRGLTIDVAAFFTPFIGYGLLQGKDSSRKWALILTWLMLIAFGVCIVVTSAMAIFGIPPSLKIHAFGNESSLMLAVIVVGVGAIYCAWQVWILRRKSVVQFFEATRHERLAARVVNKGRIKSRQFSLSTIFMVTLLAAFVMLRVCADDVQYVESHPIRTVSASVDGKTVYHAHTLYYGLKSSRFFNRPAELSYVVLAPSPNPQVTTHGGLHENYRTGPDDQKISSSSGRQLYEIVDGRTHWREERITLEELMKFVDSRPAEWTLEALVRHAEQSRAGK